MKGGRLSPHGMFWKIRKCRDPRDAGMKKLVFGPGRQGRG